MSKPEDHARFQTTSAIVREFRTLLQAQTPAAKAELRKGVLAAMQRRVN
jgi:hypothetical protein